MEEGGRRRRIWRSFTELLLKEEVNRSRSLPRRDLVIPFPFHSPSSWGICTSHYSECWLDQRVHAARAACGTVGTPPPSGWQLTARIREPFRVPESAPAHPRHWVPCPGRQGELMDNANWCQSRWMGDNHERGPGSG